MRMRQWLALGAVAAVALIAVGGAARAGSNEDDLAVVKKAVSKDAGSDAKPSGTLVARAEARTGSGTDSEAAPPPTRARRASGAEPQWLRVRVMEKSGMKRNRVSVNLPLSLVRALADDGGALPIDWKCRHDGRRCDIDLRAILRSLETGQELVEVDNEDSTVKVWVE